jgi:hypothetical protein
MLNTDLSVRNSGGGGEMVLEGMIEGPLTVCIMLGFSRGGDAAIFGITLLAQLRLGPIFRPRQSGEYFYSLGWNGDWRPLLS